ncbi:MAG: hypothetical protein LBD51_03090 [Bifidobacteriaceae bacterium]|nr:hypothetical protein [Bifidobacteriaceae bacterium]
MKHRDQFAPAASNPTLAEWAWPKARRAARLVRSLAKAASPRRASRHKVVEAGSRHAAPAARGARQRTPGGLGAPPAGRAPNRAASAGTCLGYQGAGRGPSGLGQAGRGVKAKAAARAGRRAAATGWAGIAAAGRRAAQWGNSLAEMWRRPLFAAAVAGTVAAAFPLALLLGGNAHTFALWHDSQAVEGAAIRAGDLDLAAGPWTGWSQKAKVGHPADGGVPAGQHGICLKAPDPAQPNSCGDNPPTLPLEAFAAMPGDVIELVGEFTTDLDGENIAAWLKVDWAALGAPNPAEVTATYALDAWQGEPASGAFVPVVSRQKVGQPLVVATKSAAPGEVTAGGVKIVPLPQGIHTDSTIEWRVTVTLEFKDTTTTTAAPYPYQWTAPANPTSISGFTVPKVTWELEQVRVGEGWGVPIP